MTILPATGLLFDCDGVLVDSDASVISAWSTWAVRFGLDPGTVIGMVHGRRSADTVKTLLPAELQADALLAIDMLEVEVAREVTALPGAAELLASLAPGSWAVVTSGVSALARARLNAAGLPVPATLITADRVSRGKPDPEGYLLAAAELGCRAADCVVFEDAPSGIQAARAAAVGIVVGVGPRSADQGVDLVVPDLSHVSFDGTNIVVDTT